MKRVRIYSDAKLVSDREAEIYLNILASLGIKCDSEEIETPTKNYVLADLIDTGDCNARILNCIKSRVGNMSMFISEFIEQYSQKDMLSVRGFGSESCHMLEVAFLNLGYIWK